MITILSQGDAYHSARAREQREQWLEQLSSVTDGDQVTELASVCSAEQASVHVLVKPSGQTLIRIIVLYGKQLYNYIHDWAEAYITPMVHSQICHHIFPCRVHCRLSY